MKPVRIGADHDGYPFRIDVGTARIGRSLAGARHCGLVALVRPAGFCSLHDRRWVSPQPSRQPDRLLVFVHASLRHRPLRPAAAAVTRGG
jgi:hypothetical protein